MLRILYTACLIGLLALVFPAPVIAELQLHKTGLWYGEGIERVFQTGENLAYTREDPTIDPRMTKRAQSFRQALIKVGKRTYVAYGWALNNTIMVVGDSGLIVIDPPRSMDAGPAVFAAFRTVTALPVEAIVYTQSSFESLPAAQAFTTDKAIESGSVEIYAHESFMSGLVGRVSSAGPIRNRRTAYDSAGFLPPGPDGPVHSALGPSTGAGPTAFWPPTETFSQELDLTIAGVRLRLEHIADGQHGQVVVWLPETEILLSGGFLQGENFPSLKSHAGSGYREPLGWVKGIDELRSRKARYLLPSHGRPVGGPSNVAAVLTAYRDAIQYVHDQTIRYMNQGYAPDQLVERVVLPPHLALHPWLNEHYGTVKQAVRDIYDRHFGWYHGDPWMLDPLPFQQRARRTVELMGGRDAVMGAAQDAIDAREFTWAAELLTPLIRMDNGDMQARELKAEAYRRWARNVDNVVWRNWSLAAATELEGENSVTAGFLRGSPDMLESLPDTTFLDVLAARVNPERSHNARMIIGLRVEGADQSFGIELRHGVVEIHPFLPPETDATLVAERAAINRLFAGESTFSELPDQPVDSPLALNHAMMAALERGDVRLEHGSGQDLETFFSYFDEPVDTASINLVVR